MARGWESKDVESQMEQREADRAKGPQLTAEQLARHKAKESLLLSIRNVETELANSQHPRRKEQLDAALAHLRAELEKLA